MLEYIDLKYKPGSDDLLCEYYIEPNGMSIEKASEHIAAESSIGTWTDLSTMNKEIAKKLKPNIYSIDAKNRLVKIAYPSALFERGNMPQILSSVAGNVFGMKAVDALRLEDIRFPKCIVDSFAGPLYGIDGIRKLSGIKKRPLVGTIVKPKVGLNSDQHAKVAFDAWVGGMDIVKDDENLSSQNFNVFEDRIRKTLEMRDKAESITGERKFYMPNITAETDEMLKRAEFVKQYSGEYIMVDVLTVGWSALQTVRGFDLNMVIHGHRAGHAALTRNKRHGISMLTLSKVCRLVGVDQLHIGTIVGKMEGSALEVEEIEDEIEKGFFHPTKSAHALEQDWGNVKPVFAVCSGGLHPGLLPSIVKLLGKNIICQFGGGLFGHPQGAFAGARAIRQALEATMKNVSLERYSRNHYELRQALDYWKQ
ncbi:MAG: type III ribulose-bisphosphate carboxylase [Candidatus Woesearchaeota archaeon]